MLNSFGVDINFALRFVELICVESKTQFHRYDEREKKRKLL